MARVTGIGGVFFKAKTGKQTLSEWYAKNLGVRLEEWGGAILNWTEDRAEDKGITVWQLAEKDSEWFNPSTATFMINYRVDDLEEMLAGFRRNGVGILKGPEFHENGKFAWVADPDGNKIELWEPLIWDEKNRR